MYLFFWTLKVTLQFIQNRQMNGQTHERKERSERVKTFQQQELKVGLLEVEIKGNEKKCPKKVSSDRFRIAVHWTVAAAGQLHLKSSFHPLFKWGGFWGGVLQTYRVEFRRPLLVASGKFDLLLCSCFFCFLLGLMSQVISIISPTVCTVRQSFHFQQMESITE